MNWKELFTGIFVISIGILLLFFGFAFYLAGRNIYGDDASLIWAGGMMVIISIHTLINYFTELWEDSK